MRNLFVSPLLALSFVVSVAGCVFYFKEQFALYSVKLDPLASIKLEKEQEFRIPRARPLRLFRPPLVSAGFIGLSRSVLELSNPLKDSNAPTAVADIPESLRESYKQVGQIEYLVKNYVKDPLLLNEMDRYQLVSNTLAARLLVIQHTLHVYKKRSVNVERMKDVVRSVLVENSEVIFFEMMITFEDTLSAFPDVAVSTINTIDSLALSDEQKIHYLSLFLGRTISSTASNVDLDREKAARLALLKLKDLGLGENEIKSLAENQAQRLKKTAAVLEEKTAD